MTDQRSYGLSTGEEAAWSGVTGVLFRAANVMNFLDLDLAYEKGPIITGLLVFAVHFAFTFLLPLTTSIFPDHEVSVVTIFMWVWLAWAIISGVATVKYLEKVFNRKK
ncbi:MAG: hypothetical protein AAGI36_18605 [Pseudomonadota bacterium]